MPSKQRLSQDRRRRAAPAVAVQSESFAERLAQDPALAARITRVAPGPDRPSWDLQERDLEVSLLYKGRRPM